MRLASRAPAIRSLPSDRCIAIVHRSKRSRTRGGHLEPGGVARPSCDVLCGSRFELQINHLGDQYLSRGREGRRQERDANDASRSHAGLRVADRSKRARRATGCRCAGGAGGGGVQASCAQGCGMTDREAKPLAGGGSRRHGWALCAAEPALRLGHDLSGLFRRARVWIFEPA